MKQSLLYFILGVLLSFIITTTIRFTMIQETHTHYHANFALFVEGNRVNFTDSQYSEEISACTASTNIQPRQRVHLHENNQDVIHVHHEGVTWGHFLSNLGFTLSDSSLTTDKNQVFTTKDGKELSFILNGKPAFSVFNTMIKSEDRLLINYGAEKAGDLESRFKEVASNAKEYNEKNDPAACSGSHGMTFWEKLRVAVLGS